MSWKACKNRKKKLINNYNGSGGMSMGVWKDDDGRLHRYYLNKKGKNSFVTFCKRRANRVVRRNKLNDYISKSTNYRKEYDLWWTLL